MLRQQHLEPLAILAAVAWATGPAILECQYTVSFGVDVANFQPVLAANVNWYSFSSESQEILAPPKHLRICAAPAQNAQKELIDSIFADPALPWIAQLMMDLPL